MFCINTYGMHVYSKTVYYSTHLFTLCCFSTKPCLITDVFDGFPRVYVDRELT